MSAGEIVTGAAVPTFANSGEDEAGPPDSAGVDGSDVWSSEYADESVGVDASIGVDESAGVDKSAEGMGGIGGAVGILESSIGGTDISIGGTEGSSMGGIVESVIGVALAAGLDDGDGVGVGSGAGAESEPSRIPGEGWGVETVGSTGEAESVGGLVDVICVLSSGIFTFLVIY